LILDTIYYILYDINMQYQRKLFSTLRAQLTTPEIIVLTGMRRVGKTTLYRALFDEIATTNKIFLDIENPLYQKLFEELDYDNIWHNLTRLGLSTGSQAYVFLDEIQAMPNIVKPIKHLFDHYQIKFFLTGSSSYYLKNLFPESLAGRKLIFELFPLDFAEFLTFKNQSFDFEPDFFAQAQQKSIISHEQKSKYYEEYLQFGGFPRVVLEQDSATKKLILNDIFKSYYEKDIKNLGNFHDLGKIRDFILLLTSRIGSKIDITKISSELGITRQTAYSYLTFLEATYFISTISPFSLSNDREISGGRKVYMCDTGLLNELGQVASGSILENAIFINLKKYGKINYYQKRASDQEIDFIIKGKIAIEVKTKATQVYLDSLAKIANKLKLDEYYIASQQFVDIDNVIPATSI